jgi:hypothetical protein
LICGRRGCSPFGWHLWRPASPLLQRRSRASSRPASERLNVRLRPAMIGLAGRARRLGTRSRSESSTGLVHSRSAAARPEVAALRPQVAFPQVSYSIRSPEIALEMTSCWICSVPSKMSMVSRIGPGVSPESVACGSVRPSPSVPPDSAEF